LSLPPIGGTRELDGSRSVHAGRDISGEIFSGDIQGTITGGSITTSAININNEYLTKMPYEYAESLRNFSEMVNKEVQRENVDGYALSQLQQNVNEIAKEMIDIKQGETVKYSKKSVIHAKLAKMAESLVKVSPKIAETVANLTPLAPFSILIGESFDKMIKTVMDELKS
jgi:hypothetical protein